MDIHPSRELVASGQRAGRDRKSQAHVRIWSTESLQTLYVFGMGELDRGVTSVAFSQLVSVRLCPNVNKFVILTFLLNLFMAIERRQLCLGCRCGPRKHPLRVAMAVGSFAGKSGGE